ncbi:MAG: MFS transporter [Verrucomicrobiota bacterium]
MIELRRAEPFINLRLLAQRNFGLGAIISLAFGLGMYGVTFLLPMYLAQVQGYNAQQIGWTIMWSGAPQLIMMPVAAALLLRFDARALLTVGLVLFSGSCFLNSSLTNLTGYDQLKLTQFIRALGMPLVIVPLTTLATGGIATEQSGSASALFNMLRNLGGSIGIAVLATQLDLREKLHSVRIGESVSVYNFATQERLDTLTQGFIARGFDTVTAGQQALAALAQHRAPRSLRDVLQRWLLPRGRGVGGDDRVGMVLPAGEGRHRRRALRPTFARQGAGPGETAHLAIKASA